MSQRTKEQTNKLLPPSSTGRKGGAEKVYVKSSSEDDSNSKRRNPSCRQEPNVIAARQFAESFSRELSDDTIAAGPKALGRDCRKKRNQHPGRPKGSRIQLVSGDVAWSAKPEPYEGGWSTVLMAAQEEKVELRTAQVSKVKLKMGNTEEKQKVTTEGEPGTSGRSAKKKGSRGAKKKLENLTPRYGDGDSGWETELSSEDGNTKEGRKASSASTATTTNGHDGLPLAQYWNEIAKESNREVQDYTSRKSELVYAIHRRGGTREIDGKGVFKKNQRGRLQKIGQGRSLRWGYPSPCSGPRRLRNSANGYQDGPWSLNRRLRYQGELREKLRHFDPNSKEEQKYGIDDF